MRNLDSNQLSSLYESRIVKKEVLTEAQPPYAEGPAASEPDFQKKFSVSPEDVPSTRGEAHAEKQPRLSEEATREKFKQVALEIVRYLKDPAKCPNGICPMDQSQFRKEVISPIAIAKFKLPTGERIFPESWIRLHTSREIDNVLRKAGVLIYEPLKGVKRGRPKRDLEAIAREADNFERPPEQEGDDDVPVIGDEGNEDVMQHGGEPPYMQQNEIRYQKGK